jgi:hypothetical protein
MPKQNRKWRHHYVPQLVLKQFTDDSGRLHYIDRTTCERRPPAKPRDIGYFRDFYLLADEANPNIVEDLFARFEDDAAPTIHKVIDSKKTPTTKEEWMPLLVFYAFQAARVPSTKQIIANPIQREREIIADMIRHNRRYYRLNAPKIGVDPETVSYEEFLTMRDEDFIPPLTTEEFINFLQTIANAIMKSLSQRLWTVVHSPDPGQHFIVSDDPVTLYWTDGKYRFPPPGWDLRNTDATIPVSSEVALILTHDDYELPKDNVRYHVARINSRTLAAAQHFIAAKQDSFIYYSPDGIVETSKIQGAPAIPPLHV